MRSGSARLPPWLNGSLIRAAGEKLSRREAASRIHDFGGYLDERHENEAAMAESRVRHDQRVGLDHQVAAQQKIEVERSGPLGNRAFPSRCALDGLANAKKVESRVQPRRTTNRDHGVHEPGLRGCLDGLRTIKARQAKDLDSLFVEPFDRLEQALLRLSQIRSKSDIGCNSVHVLDYNQTPRVPKTSMPVLTSRANRGESCSSRH